MVKCIFQLIFLVWIIESGRSSDFGGNNENSLPTIKPSSRPKEQSKVGKQGSPNSAKTHLNGSAYDIVPPFEVYNWETFHNFFNTKVYMLSLIMEYRDIVRVQIAGSSFEKRAIVGIKISHKEGNKGIVIEAGIHGRDWITSAAATYIMSQLVNPPNEAIRTLAETYDWYIFPIINPDGFIFTHSNISNRLWRKSLSKADGEQCTGVDLDRNWGFHWGENPEDLTPCQENYAGSNAFSETETRTFSQYLTNLKNKTHFYISLHSNGQQILYPYGYSSNLPDNVEDYKSIMESGKRGFGARYNTTYGGGSIHNALYPITGSSVDWVYGTGICRLAFNIQLRSPRDSNNGSVNNVHEEEILPICEETMDGIQNMINEANKLGYFS